ncbi:hypothetical protein EN846_33820, partial [Mesorhizobium sp. M4B.F.Ca.ET.203.01.1.1]
MNARIVQGVGFTWRMRTRPWPSQLSSIGTVTAAFDKLKTALTALKASTAFDTRTVTASKGGDKG